MDVAESHPGGWYFLRAALWFEGAKRVLGASSLWPSVARPEAKSWHYTEAWTGGWVGGAPWVEPLGVPDALGTEVTSTH